MIKLVPLLFAAAGFLVVGGLVGCSSGSKAPAGNTGETTAPAQIITAQEAHEFMESGDPIILDVRTQDEFATGHVPGAVLLPYDEIDEDSIAGLAPNKDQQVLVYCRSGRRSAEAANELVKLGYTQVYDFGGILDWPYETQEGDK